MFRRPFEDYTKRLQEDRTQVRRGLGSVGTIGSEQQEAGCVIRSNGQILKPKRLM